MVIMMMTFFTIVLAKSVANGVVGSRYCMNDPFFYKGLQSAVYSNAVKFFSRSFFDITMRKRTFLLKEEMKDLFPARGNAEVTFFQYVLYIAFTSFSFNPS
jgi:hypothetical protein